MPSGSPSCASRVHLDLYHGSYQVMRIATNIPSHYPWKYTWTVPTLPIYGGGYRLNLTAADGSNNSTYSDDFTITGSTP